MINLTPQQAHYVLQNLVARRRIRASELARALRDREREIRELKQRLASLEALGGSAAASRSSARPTRPRQRRLSARVRAFRRQQGRYMGFVRRLNSAEKARVRAVKEKQGMRAAIQLAASLARK